MSGQQPGTTYRRRFPIEVGGIYADAAGNVREVLSVTHYAICTSVLYRIVKRVDGRKTGLRGEGREASMTRYCFATWARKCLKRGRHHA